MQVVTACSLKRQLPSVHLWKALLQPDSMTRRLAFGGRLQFLDHSVSKLAIKVSRTSKSLHVLKRCIKHQAVH